MIDNFNVQNAISGGLLIGLASSLLLLFLGKVSGISGAIKQLLNHPTSDQLWKYTFILGLILGSLTISLFFPQLFQYSVKLTLPIALVGGLLVGFGTSLGSGCTSGHGVSGLPRFSIRSWVAVCCFMTSAITVVALKRVIGL